MFDSWRGHQGNIDKYSYCVYPLSRKEAVKMLTELLLTAAFSAFLVTPTLLFIAWCFLGILETLKLSTLKNVFYYVITVGGTFVFLIPAYKWSGAAGILAVALPAILGIYFFRFIAYPKTAETQ